MNKSLSYRFQLDAHQWLRVAWKACRISSSIIVVSKIKDSVNVNPCSHIVRLFQHGTQDELT